MLFLVAVQQLITMESLIFVGVNFRGLLKFNWVMGTHFRIRELFYPTNRNMTLYPQFIKLWRMFNLVGNVPKKCNDFSV